ncbi:MAG: DUF1566 domain-containing protein [Bacteroidota bacterium]
MQQFNNKTIWQSLSFLLLLLFLGCEGTKEEVDPKETYIAEKPVVIDYNGSDIYVHPLNNAEYIAWGDSPSSTGATSDINGEENTRKILETYGEGEYAAYICDTLKAYGYEDWYLPASEELNAIYSNSDKMIGLESDNYWSSTETSSYRAWIQGFYDGEKDTVRKYNGGNVRCVRRE